MAVRRGVSTKDIRRTRVFPGKRPTSPGDGIAIPIGLQRASAAPAEAVRHPWRAGRSSVSGDGTPS